MSRHLVHRWRPVEIIGRIATYRCAVPGCPKTKTRVSTLIPPTPDGSADEPDDRVGLESLVWLPDPVVLADEPVDDLPPG